MLAAASASHCQPLELHTIKVCCGLTIVSLARRENDFPRFASRSAGSILALVKAWCDGWSIFSRGKNMTSVERMAPVPSMSSIVVLDDDENDGYTPRPPQVSLTPEQLQRMARQRELALTRRMQREQQQLLQEGGRILPLSSGYPRQGGKH